MISDNIEIVRNEIAEAAALCGRDPSEITIVAVSKTRTAAEIDRAISAGMEHLGENRVQEAESKIGDVHGEAVWHLVGHLQSNKAKRAVPLFDWVDSVDSEKIADILSREAVQTDKTLNVLVQINVSGEDTKSGISESCASDLAGYTAAKEGLRLRGLMTIGSLGAQEAVTHREFARLRKLFESMRSDYNLDVLSMGMSGDFRIAVEEGSTMVRIGTAIFGSRE